MGRDAVPDPRVDPTSLLEQGPWIARLARSLTSDDDLARDLTQETYVAALRAPPRDAALLKPWIARVLQNLVRQRRRSDSNRRAREAAQARHEWLPSASDTAERLEMQRRLVDALAGLDEPLRTTTSTACRRSRSPNERACRRRRCAGG
jgi:DNA-directed RNA polymerase specialized sigma24 family protein